MENLYNARLLLVYILTKTVKHIPDSNTFLNTSIKLTCSTLSRQIIYIKEKENYEGTPTPDSPLFEKETLSKEECLENIKKLHSELSLSTYGNSYSSNPLFSDMNTATLIGSVSSVIKYLEEL